METEQYKKTVGEIEGKLKDLYPRMQLAYLDYRDNTGDNTGLRERLWAEYKYYEGHWNKLVDERYTLLNKALYRRFDSDWEPNKERQELLRKQF